MAVRRLRSGRSEAEVGLRSDRLEAEVESVVGCGRWLRSGRSGVEVGLRLDRSEAEVGVGRKLRVRLLGGGPWAKDCSDL